MGPPEGAAKALLALSLVAGCVFVLARLQVSHLLALGLVSAWVGLYAYVYVLKPGPGPATTQAEGGPSLPDSPPMKFLQYNSRFLDALQKLSPLKRFDRARFEQLGRGLDRFQKQYMYIMSGRAPTDLEGMKDMGVEILKIMYSLYVVVPRNGKHFYGNETLWDTLDAVSKELKDVLKKMCDVVETNADRNGEQVPNQVGVEPMNREARHHRLVTES